MEYITTAEVAEKWGVSLRQVQRLSAAGRIPDVKKHARDYLIPADATKPGDSRFERIGYSEPFNRKSLSQELAEIITKTTLPTPRDNPNAIFEMIEDENLRVIPKIFFAYMKGDFECVKHCFAKTEGNDAIKLIACTIAVPAAISTGDYTLYLETENWLKSIVQKNIGADVTAFAQFTLASAYASAYAPAMVHGWVKDGDFSAIAPILRPNAALLRAKYFQCTGQYEAMLATAETALAFVQNWAEGKILMFIEIYLTIVCAIACCGLKRMDEAKRYLLDAMNTGLPHGYVTPFAESALHFGGLLKPLLASSFPDYYGKIVNQGEDTIKNWIIFHNRFTKDNVAFMLPVREYQIARLVTQGTPYKMIAEQYNLSVGSVTNIMQKIYEILFISGQKRKQELAKYIL